MIAKKYCKKDSLETTNKEILYTYIFHNRSYDTVCLMFLHLQTQPVYLSNHGCFISLSRVTKLYI